MAMFPCSALLAPKGKTPAVNTAKGNNCPIFVIFPDLTDLSYAFLFRQLLQPRLRLNSRLMVEGARPSKLAMEPME
jgi:hypothetical protein